MTTEIVKAPELLDIARDLLHRVALTMPGWTALAGQVSEAQRVQIEQDSDESAEFLRRFVADHGWPRRGVVGSQAAEAAWLIALHSSGPECQGDLLHAMADAVYEGEAEAPHWAHLYDRHCTQTGTEQYYGTQFVHGPGGVQPYPTVRPETLDERRALVGLRPHAEKAAIIRERHGGPAT